MADLAVLERMKAYASEERLKEVKRKMEELRRQNTLERQKLQACGLAPKYLTEVNNILFPRLYCNNMKKN